jgi:hypothetical protein
MRSPGHDRASRRWQPNRRLKLFAFGVASLFAVLVISVIGGRSASSDAPAPPATLKRIAAKNRDAAAEAAARMKARSEQATLAADARLDAAEANLSAGNDADAPAAAGE